MKVSELIEQLKLMPQDLEVLIDIGIKDYTPDPKILEYSGIKYVYL